MNAITLTGLWLKKTKAGETFMTGPLGKNVRVLIFKNDRKQSDQHPDYFLKLAPNQPKSDQGQQQEGAPSGDDAPF